jgi:hypothetical protein
MWILLAQYPITDMEQQQFGNGLPHLPLSKALLPVSLALCSQDWVTKKEVGGADGPPYEKTI